MTERDALMRTIAESPEDDAARLVFADWLDENGDDARAAFIRMQVRRAQMDAFDPERFDLDDDIDELRAHYQKRWLAELPALPNGAKWGNFERGFPASIGVRSYEALIDMPVQHATYLPLTRLELRDDLPNILTEISVNSRLGWVRELQIDTRLDGYIIVTPNVVQRLRRAEHFSELRELDWGRLPVPSGSLRGLVNGAAWGGLKSLFLHGAIDNDFAALVESPGCSTLVDLSVFGSVVGDAGMVALVSSDYTSNLRRLAIGAGELSWLSAGSSRVWPGLGRLESLHFVGRGFGANDWAATIGRRSEPLALSELSIDLDPLSGEVFESLASADIWPNLRTLRLRPSRWPNEAVQATLGPWLRGVRSLSLECPFRDNEGPGPAGAIALARCAHLADLRVLSLWNWSIEDEGLNALIDGPAMQNLEELYLADYWVSQESFRRLADPRALPKLRKLSLLGGIQLTRTTAEALRERFGRRLLCSVRENR